MTARGRGRPRATTHDKIREVAMRLFQQHGYAGTSLEQIADAVGISRTTLFSYFPAKRDLVWEELDQAIRTVRETIHDAGCRPLVDVIVTVIVTMARYRAADRNTFAARWRLVQNNEELRAHTDLQATELSGLIVELASRRDETADAVLVDHVTRALLTVAARSTEEWSQGTGQHLALDDYTAQQLRPFADALRGVLS